MRARVRHHHSPLSTVFTAIALVVLATARLPDAGSAPPPAMSAIRVAEPVSGTGARHTGLAVRIGLGTLLLVGLVFRLRVGD